MTRAPYLRKVELYWPVVMSFVAGLLRKRARVSVFSAIQIFHSSAMENKNKNQLFIIHDNLMRVKPHGKF